MEPTKLRASELRIGNYVVDLDGSITRIASGADIDGCWEPVILTEEWLKLIELPKDNYDIFKQVIGSGYSLMEDFGDGTIYYIGHFEHVHQLQNLYFALTGSELTIKEQ